LVIGVYVEFVICVLDFPGKSMAKIDNLKRQAALKAVEFIESGMVLGLGSGSTAYFALEEIGKRIREGHLKSIIGIPSSIKTAADAKQFGIPMGSLDDYPEIDLTIDGADEVDPNLNVIKGGGGALLREKILAQNSRRFIIIVDESKLSPALGVKRIVPVEVIPFGCCPVLKYLKTLSVDARLRLDEKNEPFQTDQGNFIIDCKFEKISQPHELAAQLKAKAGIVEHGLFLGLATDVIVAAEQGVQHIVAERTKSDKI
jgi:ribose 5-phosphate isomerase A